VVALRQMPPPPDVIYFVVKGDGLEHTYVRQDYDWGRILHDAWGGFDRLGVSESSFTSISRHDYTPLGISRQEVANFRRWRGYGNPGPPDNLAILDFAFAPELKPEPSRRWRLVGEDLIHRVGLSRLSREDWLRGLVIRNRVESVSTSEFDLSSLQPAAFTWPDQDRWRDIREIRGEPAMGPLRISVHPDVVGRFSTRKFGPRGMVVRCDELADSGKGVVNIAFLPREEALGVDGHPGRLGIRIEYSVDGVPPARVQFALVGEPSGEVTGAPRNPGEDALELWSSPAAAPQPRTAWLVITATRPGAEVQIHNISAGWVTVKHHPAPVPTE
ncbi:MAG: hypothetical protein Q7V01_01195, partial [Vicinamibacterales bacterium]|nr:hypothetical protein [Vicinamibacterales bacterium]